MTDPVDIDEEELLREDEGAALDESIRKRHPGDFDVWPSDEQLEYFKRGGR